MQYDATSVPGRYRSSRALTPGDVERWVRLVKEVLPHTAGTLLIDLGCGTGRFTGPLAEQLGASVIGVDPSQKMLREATCSGPYITYLAGSAEFLSFRTSIAALIFMSNALHHVKTPITALREMWRVLKPHGIVFVRNYSCENLASLHYLRFFPEAMQLSRNMLWPRSTLIEYFTANGFTKLSQGTVHQETSPDLDGYLSKIESRVYSDLALIEDDAFERGMARIKDEGVSLGGGPILEEIDYFIFQKR